MWLDRLPKVELHCHLDGSIPLEVLKDLCVMGHITVPGDEKQFRRLAEAGDNCESLTEYLKAFELPLSCLKTEESFFRASYAVAAQAAMENVKYMEIRFAPLLSETSALAAESVIEASIAGLQKACKEKGIYTSLILCGMRHFSVSDNYRTLDLGKQYLNKGVCGIDLAGDESAYQNELFLDYFKKAENSGIPLTVHSGECSRIQNIELAVEYGARRIGHGIAMRGNDALQELIRKKEIGVELCPNSNIQTGAVASAEEYPFREFLDHGVKISINTDNRTVTNTTMKKELQFLDTHFGLSVEEAKRLMMQAMETSFAEKGMKESVIKEVWQWKEESA